MQGEKRILGNRFVKYFALLLLSMLMVSGVAKTTTVFAQTETALPDSSVTVDYASQEIKVSLGSNTQLYIGRGTIDNAPKTYEEVMEEAIDAQTKIATIDISYLSPSKDEYIYVKGDATREPLKVLVKKQQKLKASFVGLLNTKTDSNGEWASAYSKTESNKKLYPGLTDETGYIQFTVDGKAYTKLENIEWRKGTSSNWSSLKTLDLKKYTALGAKLEFRINTKEEQISTVAKVNYAKTANAPAISIDGAKLSVKLTNKIEYRVKVASGAYGEWKTYEFADKKTSGSVNIKDLDNSISGDGISTSFQDMKVQFRVKAVDKKTISKSKTLDIEVPDSPTFGSTGLEVKLVDSSNITKGIKVINHTKKVYQVAVLNKKVSDSVYGAYAAISNLNLTATSKQTGYIAFTNVAADKEITIPYSKYKNFADDYVVVGRLASIKDTKNTAANEFRIASPIKPVGGDIPKADIKSGAVILEENQNTISKDIKFTVEKVDSEIYVSVNDGTYELCATGLYKLDAKEGDVKTIKAYSKNKVTNELSDTLTIRLSFVAGGELDDYKNEWGYYLSKTEDAAKGSSIRTIAYQRVYLAFISYNTEPIDISDLKINKDDLNNAVQRVRIDNPELLQAKGPFTYSTDISGNITKVTLAMISKAQAEALMAECIASLNEVKAKIKDDTTTVQKIKIIHDYLVLKKEYKASSMDQNIAGVLSVNYTPVCMSYSMAFKYLCDEFGIQSVVVLGYGNKVSHAWNLVNLGDTVTYATDTIDPSTWYEMDVTWDDPENMPDSYVGYNFFLITTQVMEANKHVRRFDFYSSYPVKNCTGTGYVLGSVIPDSYFSNGERNTTISPDVLNELLKKCGEVIPKIEQVN